MALILMTDADPGTAQWLDQGSGATGLNPEPLVETGFPVTRELYESNPQTNTFSSSTITVPYTGTWDIELNAITFVTGQRTSGTGTVGYWAGFTIDGAVPATGAPLNFIVPWQPQITNTGITDQKAAGLTIKRRVSLTAGQVIGLAYGLILAPTGTVAGGFYVGTSMQLNPISITL